MAHIQDRRKTYAGARWKVRYRGPDGRERSRSFSRKSDAAQFAASIETELSRGTWVDPRLGQQKFSAYVESWLDGTSHLAPGTRDNIVSRLNNHLLPAFGHAQLRSIRSTDIRSWIHAMVAKGLAGGTIRSCYWLLGDILRSAENDGFIARSPCATIDARRDLPRDAARHEVAFLEPTEVKRLAEAVHPRYAALIYTAAFTGLRAGELCALRWERVDLDRGVISVNASASDRNGKIVVGPTKTGTARRVSMPPFLIEALVRHRQQHPSPSGFVFTDSVGGPLRYRNWYKRHFRPAVRAAGVHPRLRFHDLRHTCASMLIAQGAHPKEIQERLGHSTIRLTFDRYGHLFPSLDDRLRDGLQAAFEAADAASMRPGTPDSGLPDHAVKLEERL